MRTTFLYPLRRHLKDLVTISLARRADPMKKARPAGKPNPAKRTNLAVRIRVLKGASLVKRRRKSRVIGRTYPLCQPCQPCPAITSRYVGLIVDFRVSVLTQLNLQHKNKEQTADDLKDAAEDVKKGEGVDLKEDGTVDKKEAKKEDHDLGSILDRLNLAAVNNRLFSFSKESQELMERFKQVLMDIVNGAPTAYDDLEKLLRDSDGQLQKMYENLPPFLKTLIKSLPAKMTGTLGPELLAAASEKRGFDAKAAAAATETDTEEGDKKKAKKSRIPPLKKLVSQQGAVASMLRSILNFLQLRFPMFITGTNVLMSLAVFRMFPLDTLPCEQ